MPPQGTQNVQPSGSEVDSGVLVSTPEDIPPSTSSSDGPPSVVAPPPPLVPPIPVQPLQVFPPNPMYRRILSEGPPTLHPIFPPGYDHSPFPGGTDPVLSSLIVGTLATMNPDASQRFLNHFMRPRKTLHMPPMEDDTDSEEEEEEEVEEVQIFDEPPHAIFVFFIPTEDQKRYDNEQCRPRIRRRWSQSLYENVRHQIREDFEEYFYARGVLVTHLDMFCTRSGHLSGYARMEVLTAEMQTVVLERRRYRIFGRHICVAPYRNAENPVPLPPPPVQTAPCLQDFCPFFRCPLDQCLQLLARHPNQRPCPCAAAHIRNYLAARVSIKIKMQNYETMQLTVRESPALKNLEIHPEDSGEGDINRLESDFLVFLALACPRLEVLSLHNLRLNGSALCRRTRPHCWSLPRLRKLELKGVELLREKGVRCFLRCSADSLQQLHIRTILLTRPFFVFLPRLQKLCLENLMIGETALSVFLSHCPQLDKLKLCYVTVISYPNGLLFPDKLPITKLIIKGGLMDQDVFEDLLSSCCALKKLKLENNRFPHTRPVILEPERLPCAETLQKLSVEGWYAHTLRVMSNWTNCDCLRELKLSTTFSRRRETLELVQAFIINCVNADFVVITEFVSFASLKHTEKRYRASTAELQEAIRERRQHWTSVEVFVQLYTWPGSNPESQGPTRQFCLSSSFYPPDC